jgi:hypothetical protein
MPITVTVPIVAPPTASRHAGGNSAGHAHSVAKPKAPRAVHIKAPPKPKAPTVAHLTTKAPRIPKGATVIAGTNEGLGTAVPSGGVTPMPTGLTVAQQGNFLSSGNPNMSAYAMAQAANQGVQKQNLMAAIAGGAVVDNATRRRFGLPTLGKPTAPLTGPGAAAGLAMFNQQVKAATPPAAIRHARAAAVTTHTTATLPPKVTAPLQLTDSGLLGHDSHVFHPPTLTAVAPIVRRRPH